MTHTGRLRWGLIGAGTVAYNFAQSLRLLPEHSLQAVASRTHLRAQKACEDLGANRAYDSFEALVKDPDVDVVYIATPSVLHSEHIDLALSASKPVLCEKPFTVDPDDARRLIAKARANRTFCMEAMWMRFIPAIQELKSRILRSELGEVRYINAELGSPIEYMPTSRYYDPELGGGALLDLGIYPLSLAWFLIGRPRHGRALASNSPNGVDDQMAISLSFPNGAVASLSCSFAQRLRNSAFVAGTKGSVVVGAPLYAPSTLVFARSAPPISTRATNEPGSRLGRLLNTSSKIIELRRRYAPVLRQIARRERQTWTRSFPGFGYQFEAEEVARCLRQRKIESDFMPHKDTIEIIEAIHQLRLNGEFDWNTDQSVAFTQSRSD